MGSHDTDGQTDGATIRRICPVPTTQSQFTNTNDGTRSAAYELHEEGYEQPWRVLPGLYWTLDRLAIAKRPGRIARHRGIGVIQLTVMASG